MITFRTKFYLHSASDPKHITERAFSFVGYFSKHTVEKITPVAIKCKFENDDYIKNYFTAYIKCKIGETENILTEEMVKVALQGTDSVLSKPLQP